MFARIYQPAPSAMSSGRAKSQHWVLEFTSNAPKSIDPLTGNAGSVDMRDQLDLTFDSADAAIAYAKANNIAHIVTKAPKTKRVRRSYSDNFNFDRKLPWTH